MSPSLTFVSAQIFLHHQRAPDGRDAVTTMCDAIDARLREVDAELYDKISSVGVSAHDFAPKWLNTLFTRNLPPWDLMRMYEGLLAAQDRTSYLVHLCCALAGSMSYRHSLMHSDDREYILILFEFLPALRYLRLWGDVGLFHVSLLYAH